MFGAGNYNVVRIVIGVVLLIATGLKGFRLATTPVHSPVFVNSPLFDLGLIEFECFLALWLFSGNCIRTGWWIVSFCFVLFSAISIYRALTGESTCGCFGHLDIHPWFAGIFDLILVAVLVVCRPAAGQPSRLPTIFEFLVGIAFCFTIGGLVAWRMENLAIATLAPSGEIDGSGRFVALEPRAWIGKPFPLLSHIDIGDQLKQGEWSVLLYRHGCVECQKAMMRYELAACDFKSGKSSRRVAVVELAPFSKNRHFSSEVGDVLHGRLGNDKEWLIPTPTELVLKENVVYPINHLNSVNE